MLAPLHKNLYTAFIGKYVRVHQKMYTHEFTHIYKVREHTAREETIGGFYVERLSKIPSQYWKSYYSLTVGKGDNERLYLLDRLSFKGRKLHLLQVVADFIDKKLGHDK